MSFGREAAVRAGGAILAIGIAWAAVGYFTFGVFVWLAPYWGTVGSAFGTAGICVTMTGVVAMGVLRGAGTPVMQSAPHNQAVGQRADLVLALKELSADHPLLAVCAAAVLGAVGGDDARRR
jgi:hypothetical protein